METSLRTPRTSTIVAPGRLSKVLASSGVMLERSINAFMANHACAEGIRGTLRIFMTKTLFCLSHTIGF